MLKISFKSDEYREEQLRQLQRLREMERERQRQIERERQRRLEEERLNRSIENLENKINILMKYEGLSDPICDNMAAFMLNFNCSMMLDSEHNVKEFFGTEEEARELRKNLSQDCQKTSREIRSEILQTKMAQDPIYGLITVNRLKEYMPDDGIIENGQFKQIIDKTKQACTTLIKKADTSKLDNDDKEVVKELVSMVESADGLNFGIKFEEKLKNLINKANKRAADVKLNTSEHVKSFIPPVQVKYRDKEDQIQDKERERV